MVPDLYWYRLCSPTCEANAALGRLWDARVAVDHAMWRLYLARRALEGRYASLNLALARVDDPEGLDPDGLRTWDWNTRLYWPLLGWLRGSYGPGGFRVE